MREIVKYLIILVFIIGVYHYFDQRGARFFYTNSRSMEPSFLPGDHMIVMKTDIYRRGDVLHFISPTNQNEYLMKRLIGLPGDVVEIKDGNLSLNGHALDEPYLEDAVTVYRYGPMRVPAGRLFVLGDNRNNSDDSSVWGFLPKENVIGKAVFIYWPPFRIRRVPAVDLVFAEVESR